MRGGGRPKSEKRADRRCGASADRRGRSKMRGGPTDRGPGKNVGEDRLAGQGSSHRWRSTWRAGKTPSSGRGPGEQSHPAAAKASGVVVEGVQGGQVAHTRTAKGAQGARSRTPAQRRVLEAVRSRTPARRRAFRAARSRTPAHAKPELLPGHGPPHTHGGPPSRAVGGLGGAGPRAKGGSRGHTDRSVGPHPSSIA